VITPKKKIILIVIKRDETKILQKYDLQFTCVKLLILNKLG